MTKTDLRIEALRLAIATTGNANKTDLAGTYLAFLSEDLEEKTTTAPQGQQKPKR